MTSLTRTELQRLAAGSDDLRLTIYLPLQQAAAEAEAEANKTAALLQSVLTIAKRQLEQSGLPPQETRELLQAVGRIEHSGDLQWSGGAGTIAVLASIDSVRTELLPYPCPLTVDVGHEWYLAPLMRLLTWPLEFHLVTLSEDRVSLYRGSRNELTSVALPISIPRSLNDCLSRKEAEQARPCRIGDSIGRARLEGRAINDQAGFPGSMHDELSMFVSAVARESAEIVSFDPLPIVLAAEEDLHPTFREACEGTGLAAWGICVHPEKLTRTELHQRAMKLVDAHYESERLSARDRFQRIAETAEVSRRLEEVVPAACQGRVNSVIAAFGQRIWGSWNPEDQTVVIQEDQLTRQPGATDLLDLALRQTLRHGGDVSVVSPEYVPDGASLATVLRW